uniref:Uncharacterized protein n=1 Tax=Arundo donax TaxID=35708 RepID=A0A0A9FLX0_ARUDO
MSTCLAGMHTQIEGDQVYEDCKVFFYI